jgi:uncharacterized protein YlxP (DUF503 family)
MISDKESAYLNKTLRKLHIVQHLFQTVSVLIKYGAVSSLIIFSIAYGIVLCIKLFDTSALMTSSISTTVLTTLYSFTLGVVLLLSLFVLLTGGIFKPSSILYFNRSLKTKTTLTRSVFARLHRAYSINSHKTTFQYETRVLVLFSIAQIALGIPMLLSVNRVICPFIGLLNMEVRLWEIHTFLSSLTFVAQVAVTSRYYDWNVLPEESRRGIGSTSPRTSHLVDSLMSSD